MTFLPIVGDSNNTWGTQLNNWLGVSLNPTGTLNTRYAQFNVKDYGAKGDGVTDDTVAIQAAATAWKTGGELVFPSGSYLVTKSIDLTSVGSVSAMVTGGGVGATKIIATLTEAFPVFDFTGSQNASLADMRITGVGGSQTCGVLGARQQSPATGDNARWTRLQIDGAFSKCTAALINCDITQIHACTFDGTTGGCVGLFVGQTDMLSVGTKFATLNSTGGGNTLYEISSSAIIGGSRAALLMGDIGGLGLRQSYILLAGTCSAAIEFASATAPGSFIQFAVNGDFRVEDISSATDPAIFYISSTLTGFPGPVGGRVAGQWVLTGSNSNSVFRFGSNNQVITNWDIHGAPSFGTGGKFATQASGVSGCSFNACRIANYNAFGFNVPVTNSLVYGPNDIQNPSILIGDSGLTAARRLLVNVTNVTNTNNPTITTQTAHGYSVNQWIGIQNVGGATGVNGSWQVLAVTDALNFTITTSAPGVYTSGGTTAAADCVLQSGGDVQEGDCVVRVTRGQINSEWIDIRAASGGSSGLTNQFTIDRVAASSPAERPINVRSSVNSGTSFTTQMQILPKGSVATGIGNPGTTATDGFPYIPASAGAPTGVPTAQTGFVPMYYDTTNHKFWIYDGAWKGVVVT